jgi:Polyketide cyclase / dehydrase and lipid transport
LEGTSVPTFTHTIDVAADPATAWEVLGDLAAVGRWIPGITKVDVDGMIRRCTFADGHTQREEILDYSPATRSYRYTIDGGLPVTDNRGRFAVESSQTRQGGARIIWESSFVALDPASEDELSRMWAGMLPRVLGNLKALVEQRAHQR